MAQPPNERRAEAYADALLGMSVKDLVNKYQVDKATASRWRKAALKEAGEAIVAATRVPKAKRTPSDSPKPKPKVLTRTDEDVLDLGNLLKRYIKASFEAIIAQQVYFARNDFLERQSAAQMAVLHGVTADKMLRLTEAAKDQGFIDPIDKGNDGLHPPGKA